MSLHSDVKGTDSRTKEKDQVSRFHTHQTLSILLVFTVLVSAFFIMLAKQYNIGQRHEKEILLRHFKERIAHLDNLLARVTENVDGMRIAAEADLLQSRAIKVLNQPLEFKDLTDVADEKRYHLDTFKPPITREMIGNLTGQGSIQDRSRDSNREIHMALILNPLFRTVVGAIKNSAWVYYTSRNNFINIYPWVSSRDFKFSKELYTHEFYALGLPKNNPDRKRFWTKVYVDEYGKGLMTTCAAPVYDQDCFMGTVAIDLTVDFLNTVVQKFNPKQGVMFLVNDRDQLLAHPTLITSDDKRTKTLSEALPETLRSSIDRLIQIPDNEITRMGSFNILRCHLHQVPWQVFYIEHTHSLWNSFIELIGVGPVTVLAMLLILVITVFAITHKQFILPSKKFVNYIMIRSQKIQTQMDHGIPRVWKPWFAAVEKVFGENEKLTQALQEQNENLEQRVKQRTAELEKEIEGRKQIQATLRESEERFRDISYSMADWIWEIDSNGRYTFASETVKQILGYDPEELIGKSPFDLMPEEEAKRCGDVFKRVLLEKKPVVNMENWNLSKAGKRICLLTNGVPILDDSGELIGFRGVDKNITDNKIAEEKQKKLQSQLQQAQKLESIGNLAGGIAHDFNNILSSILGYTELVLYDAEKGTLLADNLQEIYTAGKRARDLIKQILAFARQSDEERKPIQMDIIAEEALKLIRSTIPTSIKIRQKLESHSLIMGNPTQVHQLFMNLCTNAAHAMEDAEGTLEVGLTDVTLDNESALTQFDLKPGNYVKVTVSDTGPGIAPDIIGSIFEPYFTTKGVGKGTGMGLAMVHGIVETHGGKITVDSELGKGTVFSIYLPITKKSEDYQPYEEKKLPSGTERILFVDDELPIVKMNSQLLERLGYRVTVRTSSVEALELFRSKPNDFDLIITDMTMPNMTGDKLAVELMKIRPDISIILCTGYSKKISDDSAAQIGIRAFAYKPIVVADLAKTVRKVLDDQQQEQTT